MYDIQPPQNDSLSSFIPVPDALRTKYEPEVEKEEQVLVHQASNITNDDAQVLLVEILSLTFDIR